jgi:excisionase family DNA binding protein
MNALKSVVEAAGLLGISPWTVRSYIRSGKLMPVRIGRRVLVEEAELERFVASGKSAAAVPDAVSNQRVRTEVQQ